MTSLRDAIAAGPVVLDGGLATQLESQGHDLTSPLWSARMLIDQPAAIVDAHRRYAEAGARVVVTSSYQASFDGFAALGVEHDDTARLLRRSVALAATALGEMGDETQRWVAASIGPYGAALADGSEYHGRYDVDVDGLRRWHRPRIDVLADSGADLLAFETIPCLAEVEALLAEIDGSGVACWLAVTCDTDKTRAGEPAEDAFAMARDVAEVVAVGVNCTDATHVAPLVSAARSSSGKPVIVYPNSGERWDASRRLWTGTPSFTTDQTGDWISRGARLVGGCCRVGPEQIREIAASIR